MTAPASPPCRQLHLAHLPRQQPEPDPGGVAGPRFGGRSRLAMRPSSPCRATASGSASSTRAWPPGCRRRSCRARRWIWWRPASSRRPTCPWTTTSERRALRRSGLRAVDLLRLPGRPLRHPGDQADVGGEPTAGRVGGDGHELRAAPARVEPGQGLRRLHEGDPGPGTFVRVQEEGALPGLRGPEARSARLRSAKLDHLSHWRYSIKPRPGSRWRGLLHVKVKTARGFSGAVVASVMRGRKPPKHVRSRGRARASRAEWCHWEASAPAAS